MRLLKKKKNIIRVAILFGAMAFAEASFFPSNIGDSINYQPPNSAEFNYLTGILKENRTGLNARDEARLAGLILDESSAYNMDPLLIMALIKTESTFYNWARSHKGAMGLMQIMPATGRWVAGELDLKWEGKRTLFDPYANVRLGIHYFSVLREHYRDDTALTLAAYNAGPTRVARLLRRGGSPPQRYAKRVLSNYKDLKRGAGLF